MQSNLIEGAIQASLAAVASLESVTSIYFVACGGSSSQMHLPKYAVDRNAIKIASESYSSAEFIARDPSCLGASSVVILCSNSGNTPETAAAAAYARGKGAYTISLTTKPESDLAKASHSIVQYVSNNNVGSHDSPQGIILRIALGILKARENTANVDAILAALPQVESIADAAIRSHSEAAISWAESTKREPLIYTMASGANWGVAYNLAICVLQEMQWIHSHAIHSGEYFHGPFEITDFDTPFIHLVGLGPARQMDERAQKFAEKFSKKVLVLDAGELDFGGVDPKVAEYLAPLVLLPLTRLYTNALAERRGHPMTVRRYMWKMEY